MAKKSTVSSKRTSKDDSSNGNKTSNAESHGAVSSGSSSTERPPTTYPSSRQAGTRMTSGVPPIVYLIFLIVPIVSMYWTSEAPKRPFSVIRTRENGEIIPVDERYQIKPNILLLTAHPDDEILFAPTILSLLTEERRGNSTLWSMCLSAGDFGGGAELGVKRIGEWNASWSILGLEEERRVILDVADMKDSPEVRWTPATIADHVSPFVLENEIDTILTFDGIGVTEHPQHSSLPGGVKHMISSPSFVQLHKKRNKNKAETYHTPRLFVMKSYPSTQQFSIFTPLVQHLQLGWNVLSAGNNLTNPDEISFPTIFISDIWMYLQTWKALSQHDSQLTVGSTIAWLMARYVWVNEWVEVDIPAAWAVTLI